MSRNSNIEIKHYEPSMYGQVVDLLIHGFGLSRDYWQHIMDNFYDHSFQKSKCFRFVAVEGNRLAGFQSYFWWPYLVDGLPTNSYQSGNTVVHSDFRRRGVYGKMLAFFDDVQKQNQISLLVGIPENQSYAGLISNGWSHIFNLEKYIKVIDPLPKTKPFDFSGLDLPTECASIDQPPAQQGFVLNRNKDFNDWWASYSVFEKYYFYTFEDGSKRVVFEMKAEVEHFKKVPIKILTIGRIQTNQDDVRILDAALKSLVKEVRRQKAFNFLYISLNPHQSNTNIFRAFKRRGFFKIQNNRKIYFLVKDYLVGAKAYDPSLWEIYKSDKETW